MKVAILSESSADQAAVEILIDALLGETSESHSRTFRTQGWTTVVRSLPAVMKELHYNSGVDALAVVLDSDETSPHLPNHDDPEVEASNCRLCKVREVVRVTRTQLKDTGRHPVQVAIGLAVPCIEAWLSCGRNPAVTEAAWLLALSENKFPYNCRQLKRDLYGTEIPGLELETRRMKEEAARLAADLSKLKVWFPNGFGPFAREVEAWRSK